MDIPSQPDKQSTANEVRNKTILQLKQERNLHAIGVGSGMMNQIRMLALSFVYYKEIDIETAREILVSASDLFLENINSYEKIHPFLENYPFTTKNIEIAIFLLKPDGSKPSGGNLTVISITNGILSYKTDHPDDGRLTRIYEETYEEASSKIRDARSAENE